MEFAFVFCFFVVGVISALLYFTWFVPKAMPRPPGPPSWPIVGSLFYLSKFPHRSMEELAKKHGPIMSLRLGYSNHIIISNAEMAFEVFKFHDVDFAHRPHNLTIGKYLGFDYSNITFSPYGDHWRLLRKICATKLLTQTRLKSFEHGRQDEMACMVENITLHSQGGKVVEMRPIFQQLISNFICRMLFGKRREKSDNLLGNSFDEFFNCVLTIVEIVGTFDISDLIPILKPFDLQGFEKRLKPIRKQIEKTLSNILKEYRKGNKIDAHSTTKDFVEILLGLDEKLDEKSTMGILTDMIVGGTDTSAITLEWALTELIRHPKIIKKAQEELDKVVGRNRQVLESDLPNLPYLQAIIKENFRLHPAVPLGIPHHNNTDAQILNYKIPANTTLFVNIWAIGRDSKVWEKPLEFDPDRFFGSNINVGGSNYNLLPFGSGRRRCPGLDLAQLMVQCGLATVLHAFDWSPQPGCKPEDMDIMEAFGAICQIAKPLAVVAKPRLSPQIYKQFI